MRTINKFLLHHHDTTSSVESPNARGLIKDLRRTWPGGVVYYKIVGLGKVDDSFMQATVKSINTSPGVRQ